MHNRLFQWRFVNARAEAAMAGVKRVAEVRCLFASAYFYWFIST